MEYKSYFILELVTVRTNGAYFHLHLRGQTKNLEQVFEDFIINSCSRRRIQVEITFMKFVHM